MSQKNCRNLDLGGMRPSPWISGPDLYSLGVAEEAFWERVVHIFQDFSSSPFLSFGRTNPGLDGLAIYPLWTINIWDPPPILSWNITQEKDLYVFLLRHPTLWATWMD